MQPEEATKKINRRVSKATKHLTTSILPQGSVRSNTALVLANAIYFKGMWSMPFDREDTVTRQFHLLDSSTVPAQFMRAWKVLGINTPWCAAWVACVFCCACRLAAARLSQGRCVRRIAPPWLCSLRRVCASRTSSSCTCACVSLDRV